jgi:hypothetical protein
MALQQTIWKVDLLWKSKDFNEKTTLPVPDPTTPGMDGFVIIVITVVYKE